MEISLPNNWKPRDYQLPLWTALEGGCKRAVAVWHRRAGKDLTGLHWLARESASRRGLYWHLFPTYSQGRKVAWEGMDRAGRPFLDAFPADYVARKRNDEMTLWLHGGSRYQVVGTDHIDRLVGANPVGVIFSEYAIQNPAAWDLIRPMLAENGGWALFVYTARGRNHGYHLHKQAVDNPNWFAEILTVDDTNAVPMDAIEEDRASGMSEPLIQQEYWCSFNAPLDGAYYGDILDWMEKQTPKRIGSVPWVPDHEVITAWDLGFADSTAIWFAQAVGRELRIIDYYEAAGEPIDHYVKVLREKPYVYGDAILPHDAAQTSLQTGRTVLEQLRNQGLKTILNQKVALTDQIAAVRLMLRQSWMDEVKCERGLQALREYVKQKVHGEVGPENETIYRDKPLHNWASHGASALATLVMGFREERITKFKQPDTSWIV